MLFITSTDTNVGKTYVSNLLIQDIITNQIFKANQIAYFKPIQCGVETRNHVSETDFDFIAKNNPDIKVFNSYFLKCAAAPNFAAKQENKIIDIQKIINDYNELKKQFDFIVVEGAGGLAVPITDDYLMSDLIKDLNLPILLVIRSELGTINHSLLSIEHSRNKNIDIIGIHVTKNNIKSLQKEDSINTILKKGNVELFDINKLKTLSA